MRLDVRIPSGLMFMAIGGLLTAYGALGDRAIYAKSLGININLIWGVAMLVAGACLLTLARIGASGRTSRGER
jgi:hypothetical protein